MHGVATRHRGVKSCQNGFPSAPQVADPPLKLKRSARTPPPPSAGSSLKLEVEIPTRGEISTRVGIPT